MSNYYDSSDRRHRDHRHDRRSHSNRGYNDYGDTLEKSRRVPGIVDDPHDRKYQRDHDYNYPSKGNSDRRYHHETTDFNSLSSAQRNVSMPIAEPRYTVTTSYKSNTFDKRKYSVLLPNILGFVPGICAVGVLIASLVLPSWMEQVTVDASSTVLITYYGLFHVCFSSGRDCISREEFASSGFPIDALEQATRSLIIIAVIIGFVAAVSSIVLGIRRYRMRFGSLINGGIYSLAAACAIGGMGCYSAFISKNASSTTGSSTFQADTSFYLGWFGAGSLLVAAIISFICFCLRNHKE